MAGAESLGQRVANATTFMRRLQQDGDRHDVSAGLLAPGRGLRERTQAMVRERPGGAVHGPALKAEGPPLSRTDGGEPFASRRTGRPLHRSWYEPE